MNMPLLKLVLKILIIAVIYVIIFWALRIMYKDIKSGNKKRKSSKVFGLEIVRIGEGNTNLKRGSVIPIRNVLSIGRKDSNLLVLNNEYISGHHAKIYIRNNECFIEDLKSTNGTIVNNNPIDKVTYLKGGDEIVIGEYVFKFIG
ncbi:FHA domain-containing protein [Clostridium ganghwense]|uniref:FHA domain-containing protein n=1 Tax=Clostridium ganghwense TaxID=312089 RepID=A0ABT4CQD8_9CLOT|nr:FHA domain-containing protein [Clostridium ganghwense]MCY6371270.1 FHA domain-containing protein [Clostridium ganghwense]